MSCQLRCSTRAIFDFGAARRNVIKPVHCIRGQGTSSAQFYRNRELESYASKEAKRLTLRQLVRSPQSGFAMDRLCDGSADRPSKVFFGRYMDQDRLIKVHFAGEE